MTTEAEVGDKIRLTVDGTVTDVSPDGLTFKTTLDEWVIAGPVDYGVEVLERAVEPFPDGTVVLSSDKVTVYRHDGRWWSTRTGEVSHFTDKLVRRSIGGHGYMKLIHEPPAR